MDYTVLEFSIILESSNQGSNSGLLHGRFLPTGYEGAVSEDGVNFPHTDTREQVSISTYDLSTAFNVIFRGFFHPAMFCLFVQVFFKMNYDLLYNIFSVIHFLSLKQTIINKLIIKALYLEFCQKTMKYTKATWLRITQRNAHLTYYYRHACIHKKK